MFKSLAELLLKAKGGPIDFDGKEVLLAYRIPILKGQEVEVSILKCDDEICKQGNELELSSLITR